MRIALISDTHLAVHASAFLANTEAALAWAGAGGIDLIVHLGDITADGVNDSGQLDFARAVLSCGPVPIRFLPGNHDIGDNPPGPGRGSGHPTLDHERLARYRALFGPDYWSVDAGRWRLLGLNAQLLGTASREEERQFGWLATELATLTGPLVLMLHKPLFRDGPADDEVHVRYVPALARRRLLAAMAGRDLRAVVSGHAHQARLVRVDGVDHQWVPSAGFVIPDAMQEAVGEKRVGIALLTLDGDRHHLSVFAPGGIRQLDLADFPEVYPAAGKRLRGGAGGRGR